MNIKTLVGNLFYAHIFLAETARKALGQLQYHLNVFHFFTKIRHSNDIATLQHYVNTTLFPDVYATQQSFNTVYPYLCGQSLKKKVKS